MRILGDLKSGNCLKVKWVCDHLALPYDWVDVDIMTGGSRTPDFLALNPWGQVPTIVLDDGRPLAQSNAIIRFLARGSRLIPSDAYAQGRMDEWLDLEKVKRGYAALGHLQRQLARSRFLVGETLTLADIALLAYTRVAHEGGFDLSGRDAVRRWIGDAEQALGLRPAG